jgi:Rad3-related DNA helicase
VDIRGEALRTVILFKLPFRPPNDPVTETLYELEKKKAGIPL